MNWRNLTCCALLVAFIAGCGAPPKPVEEISYPPAPLETRIKYVDTFYGQPSLQRSFWGKIKDFFLGKKSGFRISKPYGNYFSSQSKFFIVDTAKKGILVFDLKAGSSKFFNSLGKQGTLGEPVYLIVDSEGNIYVSDTKLRKIVVFDNEFKFSHFIGNEKELKGPVGMTFNEDESLLFVVDTQDHNVKVYNKQGQLERIIGKRGDEQGEFYYPMTIAMKNADTLFVVDAFHFAVQAFDQSGNYLFSFGPRSESVGEMARPRDIALDSDNNIYITDAVRNNVQIYNDSGELLLKFGHSGVKNGEFRLPAGIFIDDNDNIYISDSINERIQIFKYISKNERNNHE